MKEWEYILTYKCGSWLIDAMSGISEEQSQKIVDAYVNEYGRIHLNKVIAHIDADFSLSTDPEYVPRRFR